MNKIFVCHHSPLTHRKEYLINFFSSKNIEVEWVENFSPEEIVETYDEVIGTKDLIINPNVPGVQQINIRCMRMPVKEFLSLNFIIFETSILF